MRTCVCGNTIHFGRHMRCTACRGRARQAVRKRPPQQPRLLKTPPKPKPIEDDPTLPYRVEALEGAMRELGRAEMPPGLSPVQVVDRCRWLIERMIDRMCAI